MISSTSPPTILPAHREHRVSPPQTPPMIAFDDSKILSRRASTSPSDESSIIELSFDYELDSAGNYVRVSKGSSRSNLSSPPTPNDALLDGALKPSSSSPPQGTSIPYAYTKPPSPILLNSPIPSRRNSLSRSENAFPLLQSGSGTESLPLAAQHRAQSSATGNSARSFQRVASVPATLTPAAPQPALRAPLSSGLAGTGRKIGRPQRVPRDEYREQPPLTLDEQEELRVQEEKENLITILDGDGLPSDGAASKRTSPRLTARSASVSQLDGRAISSLPTRAYGSSAGARQPLQPGRQIMPGPNRAGRVLMGMAVKYGVGSGGFDKINENEGSENEFATEHAYDETDPNVDEPQPGNGMLRHRSYVAPPTLSSGTRPRRSASLSDASGEDRLSPRLLPSQNQQQHAPRPGSSLGLNSARIRRVTSEQDEYAAEYARRAAEEAPEPFPQPQPRQSPSPTHMSQVHIRTQTHHRRDSDTVRSLAINNPPAAASPTVADRNPGRLSPSTRNVSSSQLQVHGQAYHRRNPTAPEPPTTSGSLAPPPSSGKSKNGKTWAAGDEPADSEPEAKTASRVRQAPPPPAPAPAPAPVRNHNIVVNKKVYARLDLIGKGGSSRVYRVMNANNEIYAIKRVSLDKTDAETMSGYMNEIGLLKRLEGNNRIIQLFDSEVKAGPGGTKGHLMLVMECGEVDLAKLLQEQQKEPMNMVWISYYWQQMLQAVHVIHEEKIVHSDLKPANFVLVRGQLKLIDFGIANAIANDTTNIQRDHQIGTVNYMSPEAIELPDGMRRLKVGRASDVWSLGCILYQMVYGHPPFQHLSVYQKMKAIPDLAHVIEYPGCSIPTVVNKAGERKKLEHLQQPVRADVIQGIKSCLMRNSKERATIPELLEQEWLAMKEPEVPLAKPQLAQDETVINPYYMKQLLEYGIKLGQQAQSGAIDQEYLAKEAERLVAELKALES